MGRARHPLSLLLVLAMVATALATGGCGSSDESTTGTSGDATTSKAPVGAVAQDCPRTAGGVADLSVTGVNCDTGRGVVTTWVAKGGCRSGTSRTSCKVDAYRCLGARTDRGLAVSCARPGRSISFLAQRG